MLESVDVHSDQFAYTSHGRLITPSNVGLIVTEWSAAGFCLYVLLRLCKWSWMKVHTVLICQKTNTTNEVFPVCLFSQDAFVELYESRPTDSFWSLRTVCGLVVLGAVGVILGFIFSQKQNWWEVLSGPAMELQFLWCPPAAAVLHTETLKDTDFVWVDFYGDVNFTTKILWVLLLRLCWLFKLWVSHGHNNIQPKDSRKTDLQLTVNKAFSHFFTLEVSFQPLC